MKTFAYLRVSTDDQDTAAQRLGLFEYAQTRGLVITEIFEDTASGATKWQSRRLREILDQSSAGDILLIPEISRIERSTLGVLSFLEDAAKDGLTVHIIKSGMVLDASMQSKIITTVLALCGEIEREMIRARTREGMAKAKAAGKILGRAGRPNKEYRLDEHKAEIIKLHAAKVPARAMARLYRCHHTTMSRYLDKLNDFQLTKSD